MERGETWQHMRAHLSELRRHLSEVAATLDSALRRMPGVRDVALRRHPPVDVYESDEELIVRAEVPGVAKEDLSVTLRQGVLAIEGKEARGEPAGCACRARERLGGSFSREVCLPVEVDPEAQPTATLENGILTVRLKKQARARSRTIKVDVL